jgi:hypothetical protein
MVRCLMNPGLKRPPAHFYRSDSGREPVREWLKGLEAEDRKAIGEDIKDVEFSWPIGMGSLVRLAPSGKSGAACRAAALHGFFLRGAGAHGAASRLHQEDPKDPATRCRSGP